MCRSPTYNCWRGILDRCYNRNTWNYPGYGGRGITVSREWLNFENFFSDMGKKPDGLSLDRIDNNQGYSKENCRWATAKEQARNRRSSRILSCFGISATTAEWSEALEIDPSTISRRLSKGWSEELVLTKSLYKRGKYIV